MANNNKTGYFIVVHDVEDVYICFVEKCNRTDKLFKDLSRNVNSDRAIDKWEEFNEELGNDLNVYAKDWTGENWPFNGYNIIDAVPLFIY